MDGSVAELKPIQARADLAVNVVGLRWKAA